MQCILNEVIGASLSEPHIDELNVHNLHIILLLLLLWYVRRHHRAADVNVQQYSRGRMSKFGELRRGHAPMPRAPCQCACAVYFLSSSSVI